MKKSVLLFAIIGFFSFIPTIKASHVAGGEIIWKCLSNGKYVFQMKIYRDCTGVGWQYSNETLEVFGNPLPKDSNNVSIDSIALKPDSSKWRLHNDGDLSPRCDWAVGSVQNLSCRSMDAGTVQVFFYTSDTITLRGTPPAMGWKFIYTAICCRANTKNLQQQGVPIYRAIMYADKDSSNVDSCIDSSPQFKSLPQTAMCYSTFIEYNGAGYDEDLDSLVYAWDKAYNEPAINPVAVAYAQGYDFDNPTPDKSFDSLNIPAQLDSITGAIQLFVNSGRPMVRGYLAVVRIDSYRCGHKISSIFREIPWNFFSCPPLDIKPNHSKADPNNPPNFLINGKPTSNMIIDVTAGQKVEIPIQVNDFDYGGRKNNGLQQVRLSGDGYLFSKDLTSNSNCATAELAPCATLQNQSAAVDSLYAPPTMAIIGNSALSTNFEWETGCQHLSKKCAEDSLATTSHNFVFNIQDNHCPIPGRNSPSITIRLHGSANLAAPIMKGASVGLDGRITYQWVPPHDGANAFNSYQSSFAEPISNQSPSSYQILDSSISKYGIAKMDTNRQVQVYTIDTNSEVNILQKVSNKDWFFRMKTYSSACAGKDTSAYSNLTQVIDVVTAPADSIRPRSKVAINWNRPTSASSTNNPKLIYESPTHYYIWQNDSILQNGNPTGGEKVLANWYLRAHTLDTTHILESNVCHQVVGYRVEARDTVISLKQGSGGWNGNYDTLIYSTFSIIDTMKMAPPFVVVVDEYLDSLYTSITSATSYQWYDCNKDTAIVGATQRKYVPLDSGNYAVEIRLGGCTLRSPCHYVNNVIDTSVAIINSSTAESKAKNVKFQWINSLADTIMPAETNALFHAKDSGYYAVILSAYGMVDTSQSYFLGPIVVSVPEKSLADQINYYPNPTNNHLTIALEKEVSTLKVKVRNLQGQLVQEMKYHQTSKVSVELKGRTGFYFIEVSNGNGEKVNLKVIKQH